MLICGLRCVLRHNLLFHSAVCLSDLPLLYWDQVTSPEEFEKEVMQADKLVVVEWYGVYCEHCKNSYPEICKTLRAAPELKKTFKFVKVTSVFILTATAAPQYHLQTCITRCNTLSPTAGKLGVPQVYCSVSASQLPLAYVADQL